MLKPESFNQYLVTKGQDKINTENILPWILDSYTSICLGQSEDWIRRTKGLMESRDPCFLKNSWKRKPVHLILSCK